MSVVWIPSHDEIIGFQYIVFWDDTRELRRPEVQFLDVAGLPHRTAGDVPSDALGDAFVSLTGVVLNADE